MSNYVDENYSGDYVEGDTPSSTPISEVTNCDLTAVLAKLDTVLSNNIVLNTRIDNLVAKNTILSNKLDSLLSKADSNNTINMSINSKMVDVATKEYINSKVPFVDDKSLKIYPKGTVVLISGLPHLYTVESSSFLPDGDYRYIVVYTVSIDIDGKTHYSNFANSYVIEVDPEEWILKSDCPEVT